MTKRTLVSLVMATAFIGAAFLLESAFGDNLLYISPNAVELVPNDWQPPGKEIYLQGAQAVDLDQDGDLDLVLSDLYNFLFVAENLGNGTFAWHTLPSPDGQRNNGFLGLGFSDLNHDGILDIFYQYNPLVSEFRSPAVLLSNATQSTRPWEFGNYDMYFLNQTILPEYRDLGWPQDVEMFDQNGTTYVVYATGRTLSANAGIVGPGGIFLSTLTVDDDMDNQTTVTMSTPTLLANMSHPRSLLQVADLDNDGILDVVVASYSQKYYDVVIQSEVQVFWGQQAVDEQEDSLPWSASQLQQVYYARGTNVDNSSRTDAMYVVDADHDGRLDILFSGIIHGCVFRNTGERTFSETLLFQGPSDCKTKTELCRLLDIGLLDVDQTGQDDIILLAYPGAYYGTLTSSVLPEFNPFAQFNPESFRGGYDFVGFFLADFTGDGLPDILAVQQESVGLFQSALTVPPTSSPTQSPAPTLLPDFESSTTPVFHSFSFLARTILAVVTSSMAVNLW